MDRQALVAERKEKAAEIGKGKKRPSEQEIAARAHELFEARGGENGRDLDDWLQAERELFEKNGHTH
ncbi:MAG TPA: DUF2934 domain-containing protein [Candidatus Acidoferrum sp.]|nr:DUF2934 domain-containing protein [Candidatus Acidoferrum sp.]